MRANKFSKEDLVPTTISLILRKSIAETVERVRDCDSTFEIIQPIVWLGTNDDGEPIKMKMRVAGSKLYCTIHFPGENTKDVNFSIGIKNGELSVPYLIESCKRVAYSKIPENVSKMILKEFANNKIFIGCGLTAYPLTMYDIKSNINQMFGEYIYNIPDPFYCDVSQAEVE